MIHAGPAITRPNFNGFVALSNRAGENEHCLRFRKTVKCQTGEFDVPAFFLQASFSMTAVYKNFLPQAHYQIIKDLFLTERLPWHYNDRVVSDTPQFMFTHTFFNNGRPTNSPFFGPIRAMLDLIQRKRRFIGVARIKANLYTNQGAPVQHPAHYDVPPGSTESDKFCIGVYHVNRCNGLTVIGDKEIQSRDNQLILFDNVSHYGTVQTDTNTRVVINFVLRTVP